MRTQQLCFSVLSFGATLSIASTAQAIEIVAPGFASAYSLNTIGLAGVPASYGGITFKDANTLLIGGSANAAGGAIYSVPVNRGTNNAVTGFGTPTLFATAPNIDGGLAFGPNGVLFYTGYNNNVIGQIKPGSTTPDKIVNLSSLTPAVTSSVGTLAFVPSGFPGAGNFKIASYSGGGFYNASLVADGSGTFDIQNVSSSPIAIGGGPEGIAYVAAGNPLFTTNSMLISKYSEGKVSAYAVDSNGDPILSSAQDFVTGLTGAEGATIDPVTGDFLFSTFGGGSRIVRVSGFSAPTQAVPEPFTVIGTIVGGTAALRLRKKLTHSAVDQK